MDRRSMRRSMTLGSQSSYSGDMSSQGSHDSLSIGSRISGDDADGISTLRRNSLAAIVYMWQSAVPKVPTMENSWKFQLVIFLYQIIVWVALLLQPALEWDIAYGNTWYKWLQRAALFGWVGTAAESKRATAFAAILYVPLSLQLVYLGLWAHSMWGKQAQQHVTLLKVNMYIARVLEVVLFKMFSVAMIGVAFIPMACNSSSRFPAYPEGAAVLYPPKQCSDLRVHVAPAVIMLAIQIPMVLVLAIKDCQLDPLARNAIAVAGPEPLPSIYSAVAVITPLLAMASNTSFILRFLDGEGSHLTHHREASRRRNQSTGAVLAALCWLWITYVHVIRVPFIGHMHALARSFVSGALFGLFVILVAWTGGASVPVAKGLSLSLIPAFGAAAAVLTFLRIGKARHVAARFSIIARGGPPGKKMHRFMDEESLEVIMRSAVPFSPSLEADPELVSGAATAVAHAQLHHFDGATTLINLSVAQAFLGASLVSARSTIARVDMAKANIQERIITLMLETALSEMKTGQGDELDLTSYLEVQGRIKSALRAHKDTLEALRDVWKLAVRSRVGMHSIQKMFYRIHVRERFADTQYRLLLQRHPTNAHLLRAYGVWLQGVKANLAGGSKYMQEADRREIHVPQKKATQGENGVNSVNENEDAVIAVDIDGIMVMVNTPACRMFGWKKADMLGRNVNMLMPAPLAAVHNSYLKNPKMDKGQERHLRDVIGLHREGYGVSVSIAISKTVQGKRTTYIGVLRPKVLPQAWTGPSVMSLWLAPNSTVIAGDANFCTATGYTATELHACATSTIMDAATAERIIDESMEKGIKGSTSGRPVDLSLIPKGAGRAPLLCTGLAYLGGTAKTRALMLVLKRISDDMATITLSLASGSIHAANAAAHDILRYPAGSLRGRSILDLMPPEIALIHRCSWSTPAGDHELSAAFSPCMFVRPVEMARFDKTRVAVCLEVPEPSEAEGDAEGAPEKAKGAAGDRSGTQPAEGEPATIDVNVIVCKRDEVEEDTVMTLAVDPDSGRVTAVRGSALFGYEEGSALSSGSLTLSSVLHMSTSPSDLASAWAADPPRDGTPCMVKLANGGMEAALAVVSMHDLRKSRRSGPGRPPTWARQSQPGSGRPSWEHGSYLEVKLVRMDAVRILISLDESLGCKDIQSSTHCLTLTRTLAQAKGMPLSTLLPAVPMEGTLNDLFGEEEEEGEQEEREGGDGEEDRAATEGQQYVAGPRMEGIQLVMAHGPRIVTAMQAFKEEGKSEGVLMVCPMPGNVFGPLALPTPSAQSLKRGGAQISNAPGAIPNPSDLTGDAPLGAPDDPSDRAAAPDAPPEGGRGDAVDSQEEGAMLAASKSVSLRRKQDTEPREGEVGTWRGAGSAGQEEQGRRQVAAEVGLDDLPVSGNPPDRGSLPEEGVREGKDGRVHTMTLVADGGRSSRGGSEASATVKSRDMAANAKSSRKVSESGDSKPPKSSRKVSESGDSRPNLAGVKKGSPLTERMRSAARARGKARSVMLTDTASGDEEKQGTSGQERVSGSRDIGSQLRNSEEGERSGTDGRSSTKVARRHRMVSDWVKGNSDNEADKNAVEARANSVSVAVVARGSGVGNATNAVGVAGTASSRDKPVDSVGLGGADGGDGGDGGMSMMGLVDNRDDASRSRGSDGSDAKDSGVKPVDENSFMWVRMLNWLETDGRTEKSVLFPSGVQLASKWTTPSESALARLEAGWSEAHSALARARLSSASLICKDAVEEGIRGPAMSLTDVIKMAMANKRLSTGHATDAPGLARQKSKRMSLGLEDKQSGWGRVRMSNLRRARGSSLIAPPGVRGLMRTETPPMRLEINSVMKEDGREGTGAEMSAAETMDESDILMPDSREATATRQLRIHILLTSKTLMNPFLKLSKVLWIALAATVLIHAIGFSVLIALTTLQREIVSHLKYAGIQKRLAVEALAYAQIIHAPTLGVEYPWLDIAVARDRLRGVATEIKENNERLFAATKSVGGAGAKRLQELWTGYNLDVQVQPWPGNYMTLQEPFFDSMVVFSGAAFTIAAADPPLGADSFELYYLEKNTSAAIVPRVEQIEAAMQDHALASLRDIGVVAIVCLALEAGLMAPILMIIVLRQLRKVAELRLTLFSLLLAVPRPIALELSQRVVSLGELEDEEDGLSEMDNMVEEGATHQKKALQEGRDKSARRNKVRQLMAIRIPYNRVQTARNNLRLGSKSERGGYKRWIWDLSVAAPFLAWAVIIVIVQSMTWRLQLRELELLEPKFIMTIMTYDAMSLVTWSADLVVLAALGRPEEDLDVARKYLTDAVHDAIHAQNAILFGTDDFHGRQVVGGTMWGMKDLYQLHFGESCLRPNKDCLPIEDDEDAWLTRRGFYFLLSNLCDEAARIARDPTPHLTWQNSRFQTLQRFGLEELRYGAEQSEKEIAKDIDQLETIVSLHVAVMACTAFLALAMAIYIPRPLVQRHREHMWRTAQVLAVLPQDLGVDQLLLEVSRELYNEEIDAEDDLIEDLIKTRGGKEAPGKKAPASGH